MQDSQDLTPFLADLGNRLGHLEHQQDDMLKEVRSNGEALVRLEGHLDTRVAEARGRHDLTSQRDDAQDAQIITCLLYTSPSPRDS